MITDAEDLEDREQALKAVKEATKQNIQVDIIGVGSTSPVTIPTANGYFTDENGQVVKTALNENLAAALAKAGNGVYVNASSTDALTD